jgi:uncharacterized membrane protein YfcA
MDFNGFSLVLAACAVIFIGVSKAGFGGGLGMLTTPLCVVAFKASGKPPSYAVGILLPLLCAGDMFSLYHYWKKWDTKNLKYLMPGVVVGIILGVQLIDHLKPRQLNIIIGTLAVSFVLFQLCKEFIFRAEGAFNPNYRVGLPCGVGAGITSTIAHGAGPLVSLFLIPQRLPKEVYMGTNILIFTIINWLKFPFFAIDQSMVPFPFLVKHAIITHESLVTGLIFLPLVPLGVWIGVSINRKFSEKTFQRIVYATTLAAGLHLIFNFNFAALFSH